MGRSVQRALAATPSFFGGLPIATSLGNKELTHEAKTYRLAVGGNDFRGRYDVIDVDGVRVLFGDGWGLIRASNTQPVLVTRYEALSRERLDTIQREMEDWLRSQGITP